CGHRSGHGRGAQRPRHSWRGGGRGCACLSADLVLASVADRDSNRGHFDGPEDCSLGCREDSNMKYLRISLAATVALLLLAACGSLNDVLGTGSTYPTNTQNYSGNVNYVDLNARRIDLSSNGYNTTFYWNSNTQFTYQNQNVSPNSIRTGDY